MGLDLPRIAPPLGILKAHAVVGEAVADGGSAGLMDPFGVGSAGHGSAKLVGDLEDLERWVRAELRPQSLPGRLEFRCDPSDVFGRVPDADDLDPASLPIDEDVMLTQPRSPEMDRTDIFAVRLDNVGDTIGSYIHPEHSSDHVQVLHALRPSPRWASKMRLGSARRDPAFSVLRDMRSTRSR